MGGEIDYGGGMRRVLFSTLSTAAALAVSASLVGASDSWASVTLGQTDTVFADTGTCGGTPFIDIQAATGAAPNYAVPAGGGVITSWTIAGNGLATGDVEFKVFRPPGFNWLVVARSPSVPVPATATTATFAARMPVIANDVLGLMSLDGAPACLIQSASSSDLVEQGTTDEPPGSFTHAASGLGNERVNVSARLEPDIDSDGFGDETQDQCPGVPGPVNGCPAPVTPVMPAPPVTTVKKKKCKKHKKKHSASSAKKKKCKKKKHH
jgi:hypothetical protein